MKQFPIVRTIIFVVLIFAEVGKPNNIVIETPIKNMFRISSQEDATRAFSPSENLSRENNFHWCYSTRKNPKFCPREDNNI